MAMEPVVLEGRYVRMEPLTLAQAPALWAVSDYPEIYRFKPYVYFSIIDSEWPSVKARLEGLLDR